MTLHAALLCCCCRCLQYVQPDHAAYFTRVAGALLRGPPSLQATGALACLEASNKIVLSAKLVTCSRSAAISIFNNSQHTVQACPLLLCLQELTL